ncbi:MAG: hypothetical protein AAF830_10230 [Pseudomonadota bacterium]
MNTSERKRAGLAVTAGLAIPVATTAVYMATLGGPSEPGYQGFETYMNTRWTDIATVWTTEAIGFAIGIVAALGLAAQRGSERAAWNAIALGSLGGMLSTAFGLGMFKQFGTAGEEFFPLFMGVLNISFWFFFFGKAATAIGVAGLGVALLRGGVLAKLLGLVSAIGGVIAFGMNVYAMATGLTFIVPAGAAGVAATAIGALAALVLTRSSPPLTEEVA